jgi:hypothetical protein
MDPLYQYANIQPLVQKEINDAIQLYANQAKFGVTPIPAHQHTGVDSANINFEDLGGIPIVTSAPADKPEPGTVRLYSSGGTYKIYAFLSGVWKSATLT